MADGLLNKASIILTPTGYKAGTLYNVAPVVEPYEDFDFARASVASRVNSSGLVEMVGRTLGTNLIDPLDFTNWINSGSTDITSNSFTTSGSGRGVYYQLTTNNLYKINVTGVSGDISLRYRDGGGAGTILGDFDTDLYFDTTGLSSPNIYLRANSATTATVSSVNIQEIIDTNNIPRISYDSNGDNGHILLEPTSTNLFPYSEDFSGWTYVSPTSSITVNNAVSPDGTSNADTISYVGGGGNDYAYYNGGFTTTSASTFSVYARTTVGTKNIALRTWNTGIYETKTITTEWQRFTLSISSNLSSEKIGLDNRTTYGGSGTSGDIQVWGAQLEELSYATSYIPTLTGSTETRATETANGAGSADLINSTEGVLYAEIAALANDGTFRMIGISDGTESNVVNFYYRTDANKITIRLKSGGSQVIFENFDITATNFSKIAFRYKSGESNLFIDGVKQKASDYTTTNMPSGLNELAFDSGGGGQFFYGKCKALAVFNEALSDDELNNLTG